LNHNFYHIDDALLVKYLLEETSPEETEMVKEWIVSDEANKKHYDDFKLLWDESKVVAAASSLDEEVQWQKFKNRISSPAKMAPVKRMWSYQWLKVAAVIIFMAGTVALAYTLFSTNEIKTVAVNSLDKVITDTLPDKSVITLNKNSTLDYPEKFKGDTRTVNLKGEAFFSVTPDKSKPFIIHVNDVTIKVVGTSFNVKSFNGNTEVIVETGIVEVIRDKEEIDLHPNEKILVKKDDSTLTKEKEKGALYNYYRTKEFECDNTPLWQLVQALNQAYDVNIVIERKELRSLPLTTTFNNESLDHILDIIRQTFNISVTKTGNEIILK
jgi:ferric-dicitrate binding protein FerR (iron transport regulator)